MSDSKEKVGVLAAVKNKLFAFADKSGLAITGLFSLLAGVAVAYAIYSFAVADWRADNDDRETKVIAVEKENGHNQQLKKLMPPFLSEFRKMIADFHDAEPLLPSEAELAQVLAQVQEAARRNNVNLTGLNAIKQSVKMAGQPANAEFINEREFPSQIAGAYPDIVHFFSDVAVMPRILVIRDFSILALKDGKINANFTLVAYHATAGVLPAIPVEVTKESSIAEVNTDVQK